MLPETMPHDLPYPQLMDLREEAAKVHVRAERGEPDFAGWMAAIAGRWRTTRAEARCGPFPTEEAALRGGLVYAAREPRTLMQHIEAHGYALDAGGA